MKIHINMDCETYAMCVTLHPIKITRQKNRMRRTSAMIVACLAFATLTAQANNVTTMDCNESKASSTVNEASNNVETGKFNLTDTSRVYDLDEVVIVSQPKEVMRLRRQPLSSSVFTGHDMATLGVRDLTDLAGYVPSFSVPAYGSRLTSSMYIRGIGSRINNPAVGIYTDGIPLVSKNSFNFHTYQLARVDVLRGPQGTLYGMNTEGGLVRMYSKNPMDYQGTDLHFSLGTHLYRNIEAAHYQKLSDNIAFSIAGFYNGQNGFFKNITTGERADLCNEAGGKARFVLNMSRRLTADFTADYQYMRQNAFPYGLLNLTDNSVAAPAGNRMNEYTRNMLNMGLSLRYAADAFTLNSTTSYQYLSDRMMMDQDYLPQDYMHLNQRQLMNAVTEELTLKSNTKGAWQWTAGLYGSYQWLKTEAPVSFDGDFTDRISQGVQASMYNAILATMMGRGMTEEAAKAVIERAGGVTLTTDMSVPALFHTPQLNIGAFHESNVSLTDRLTLTLGLRYDYNRTKINYNSSAAMTMTANVMGKEATYILSSILNNGKHDDYNQLLPKVGLTWQFNDNGSNIYATVCKGYRAGGYNIQMFSDILQTELNANSSQAMKGSYEVPHTAEDYERVTKTISYKPEESWNYEFGAHLNLFGGMMHADISAYYMQLRNQQLSVMAEGYGFGRMMVNAGRSRSCGVEASLRGSAFDDNFTWTVSYGLTHATFKDYKEEAEDGTAIDYRDNKVPFIPMHTLGARADYRIPLSHTSATYFIIGADLTARGKTYWDEANIYSQPFYALLGAHADLNVSRFGFSVWCRNITDTRYNTFAFSSEASGEANYFAQRGNPIQAGFDIKMHF